MDDMDLHSYFFNGVNITEAVLLEFFVENETEVTDTKRFSEMVNAISKGIQEYISNTYEEHESMFWDSVDMLDGVSHSLGSVDDLTRDELMDISICGLVSAIFPRYLSEYINGKCVDKGE